MQRVFILFSNTPVSSCFYKNIISHASKQDKKKCRGAVIPRGLQGVSPQVNYIMMKTPQYAKKKIWYSTIFKILS